LRQNLIDIRIRLHPKIDNDRRLPGVGVDRIHVVHVVDAADLLLEWSGNRLLDGLCVRTRIRGRHLYFRRNDIRELRYRQRHHGNCAYDHHDDGDHHRDNRTIDKEL
jgi:hypothetical protein